MSKPLSRLFAASLGFAACFCALPTNAGDLEAIKEAGEMKIAMSGQYPPFNFVNDQNQVVGFDASIGMEIAKRLGVEGESLPPPASYPLLSESESLPRAVLPRPASAPARV